MENQVLSDLTNDFIAKTMQSHLLWPYYSFGCGQYIAKRMLRNARKTYADIEAEEEVPLIFIDSTILENGKLGVLVTNKAVYYRLFPMGKGTYLQGQAWFIEIDKVMFQERMSGSYLVINEKPVGLCSKFTRGDQMVKECIILNDLLASFISAIKEE